MTTAPEPNKSCMTCPSMLGPAEATSRYGRNIGAAMCARYGHPLSRPGLPSDAQAAIMAHKGSNCPDHGKPKPSESPRTHAVALPNPTLRVPSPDELTSCTTCKKFVPERVVADEFGWTGAGMCGATGNLLMTNRLSYAARNCQYSEFGIVQQNGSGIHLFPEYQEGFGGTAITDPVVAHQQALANFVDPMEYESDKPVTDEDKADGIRAWRKLNDPSGSGETIFLPVYNIEFFKPEEQEIIPRTGDDEHPELYIDHFGGVWDLACAWLGLDETPTLWGISGSGKTELYRHMAWLMCLPFRRVSITADSLIDDVAGTKEFDPVNGTYFSYGEVPTAWIKAGVLVIDEPNTAKDPAVWHFLRPLTDNSKQLVLTMNGNERLPRNDACYMGLAMNPSWDIRNSGTFEVADADTNRLFHSWVPLPPEELEREIMQERVKLDGWELSNKQLDSLIEAAKTIRALSDDNMLPITWGVRQQIKVARALRWYPPVSAYNKAIGNALAPEYRQTLIDQVNAAWENPTSPSGSHLF